MGREGGSAGGRCKYVHVARSPHPCGSRPQPTHPPGHGQFSAHRGKIKRKAKGKSRPFRHSWCLPSTHGVDLPCRPRSTPTNSSAERIPTDRGRLSKAGWVRWRGCPRHGCRGQAPRDGFTASPATGPAPPSLSSPAFDVASAGAGRSPAGIQHPSAGFSHRSARTPQPCQHQTGCRQQATGHRNGRIAQAQADHCPAQRSPQRIAQVERAHVDR